MKRIMRKEEFLSVHERQQASGLSIKDFMTCHLQGTESQSKRNIIARLPYYQEKDSGKDIRELLPDVWKLKKSNENPIEV